MSVILARIENTTLLPRPLSRDSKSPQGLMRNARAASLPTDPT